MSNKYFHFLCPQAKVQTLDTYPSEDQPPCPSPDPALTPPSRPRLSLSLQAPLRDAGSFLLDCEVEDPLPAACTQAGGRQDPLRPHPHRLRRRLPLLRHSSRVCACAPSLRGAGALSLSLTTRSAEWSSPSPPTNPTLHLQG